MTRGVIFEWRLFSTVRFINMFLESHTEPGERWLLHLNLCWYLCSFDKWGSLSVGFLLKKWFWPSKFKHQSMNTKNWILYWMQSHKALEPFSAQSHSYQRASDLTWPLEEAGALGGNPNTHKVNMKSPHRMYSLLWFHSILHVYHPK